MSNTTRTHRPIDDNDKFWNEEDPTESHDVIINPLVAMVVLLMIILAMFWMVIEFDNADSAGAAPALVEVQRGEAGDPVKTVQSQLRNYGYSVVVDGEFGPQTDRAVRHFQKANGLLPDGVVGPLTSRALGVSQTVRATPLTAQPAPTPSPVASGASWSKCPQWESTANYFGLPAQFDAIMYRESRCNPDVTSNTGCCKGLLQIHRIHLPKPECDAYTESDLFDPSKNLCVASVIYKRSGMSPWAL